MEELDRSVEGERHEGGCPINTCGPHDATTREKVTKECEVAEGHSHDSEDGGRVGNLRSERRENGGDEEGNGIGGGNDSSGSHVREYGSRNDEDSNVNSRNGLDRDTEETKETNDEPNRDDSRERNGNNTEVLESNDQCAGAVRRNGTSGENQMDSDRGRKVSRGRSISWSKDRSPRRRSSLSPPLHCRNGRLPAEAPFVMEIQDDDASFILGAGGRTKRKLSQVCNAELTIGEKGGATILEIRGTKETIERAKLYVGFVMQQRTGPVELPEDSETRDDLTIVQVPHECVGYVTGRRGAGLRSVEEEWNTLMFFTDLRSEKSGEKEKLAIFGTERARRGSELKVMSAVEQKMNGYFTDGVIEKSSDATTFDTDYYPIEERDYSYALGQRGSTRKKLARASGAVLEYVGRIAFIAGTIDERRRAKQYLKWLIMQRTSYVHVDATGRDDCEIVQLPLEAVAYVTGSKGSNLRRVEDETGTFIFLDGNRSAGEERLLIFCYDENARRRARARIEERIDEKLSGRARSLYGGMGGRYRSRSPDRGYYNDGYGRNWREDGYRNRSPPRYGGGGSWRGDSGWGRGGSGYYRSRSRSPDYRKDGRYSGRSRSRSVM